VFWNYITWYDENRGKHCNGDTMMTFASNLGMLKQAKKGVKHETASENKKQAIIPFHPLHLPYSFRFSSVHSKNIKIYSL
jgi:hypothetical protein